MSHYYPRESKETDRLIKSEEKEEQYDSKRGGGGCNPPEKTDDKIQTNIKYERLKED